MNKLFILVMISLSTLLFACDGEGSGNAGGSTSGGAGESPSEAIDARNDAIQQDLSTGNQIDTPILTEIEPAIEPIEIEPIDTGDEDGDALNDSLDN